MLNEINLSRVDLNLLVLFEAVMKEGHVGRAADRLSLTSSAVSHGLNRLRRLFGDPLFTRTPKGVAPTGRAVALEAPVAELLRQMRELLATNEPFDPATSTRRFTIGAPDGASAVLLPMLLDDLRRSAPGIDLSVTEVLPVQGEPSPGRAWRPALHDLEHHRLDIAVLPLAEAPARFDVRPLYDEDFVVAMRTGHPALVRPLTIDGYCAAAHILVSQSGEPLGFVDHGLAELGRSRRVALTAPNFMLAMAISAGSDLMLAAPRRLVARHGAAFGLGMSELPLQGGRFVLTAVAARAALADRGLAWLFDRMGALQAG